MSAAGTCRVLVDPPLSGVQNMAVDEVLLESAIDGVATLRFYQWGRPTVSLGHFQAKDPAQVPIRFGSLDRVRRLSGGGAILHDQELTYSCALPATHPLLQRPGDLYDLVHAVLIHTLAAQGVSSRMRGEDAFPDKPFLCFARGDARDIVVGSHKIVGSAQRRRRGAVLQHGSLLLRRSAFAEELPGVQELTGVSLQFEDLVPVLAAGICDRLGLWPVTGMLTPEELAEVERLLNAAAPYLTE